MVASLRRPIQATLATIAGCKRGTKVVLTYDLPHAVLQGISAEVGPAVAGIAGQLGEPLVSRFTPAEIEEVLVTLGFREVVHFGPDEARATYLHGRTDHEPYGAQRLVVGTV